MKDIFVQTKNVSNFISAIESAKREKGPKIILHKGQVGLGKTRTCAWYAAQNPTVYLQAEAGWNIGWFLDDLCFELGVKPEHKLSARSRQVKDQIRKGSPVLIIDEADLLRHDKRVLETIKSIHDQCDVVTVLTGTGEIEQTLRSYPQFCSRVHQAVEFEDISGTELPSIITQLSEVALAEDAMEELSKHIKTMRDIVRYLPQIERAVKGKNIKKVDRALVRAAAARIPNTRLVA
jgi:hypothetical protein